MSRFTYGVVVEWNHELYFRCYYNLKIFACLYVCVRILIWRVSIVLVILGIDRRTVDPSKEFCSNDRSEYWNLMCHEKGKRWRRRYPNKVYVKDM